MDQVTIHSIWTVLVFITFIGIIFWAYSGTRKKEFDEVANSILDDDIIPSSSPNSSNKNTKETH